VPGRKSGADVARLSDHRIAWIFAALAIAPSVAWADHFEQTVSFECNQRSNRIIIDHNGAYNEKGDLLVKGVHGDEWNIRSLMIVDAEGISRGTQKIKRSCNLSGANYEVTISGVAWGRYGQDESAHITIRNGNTTLFDADLQGSPFRDPNPVISRIVVSVDGGKPTISATTSNWW
jgi:hypothetical protein